MGGFYWDSLLKKRFLRDPKLEAKCRAVIEDCVAKGYAWKLTKEEASTVSKTTWFLPHHSVSNPNRVVFDAAARFSCTSLNEQFFQGPSLTNDLFGVFRFREEEIACSADIEGMFYQIIVTLIRFSEVPVVAWKYKRASRGIQNIASHLMRQGFTLLSQQGPKHDSARQLTWPEQFVETSLWTMS